MKCYAAKAIYHVKATVCLLALGPANPIIKYTERQCKNSTTVNAPPESQVPHRQTESWLLHQTQAAFITAIYADAALSPLMDELKERYESGGLGLDTGQKTVMWGMEGSHQQILLRDTEGTPSSLHGKHYSGSSSPTGATLTAITTVKTMILNNIQIWDSPSIT